MTPLQEGLNYEVSKISTSFIDVPLEFHLRVKPKQRSKNLWIAPGFRAGLMVNNFWKYRGDDGTGYEVKFKSYKIENMNTFHYGISLRAGYYKFGVYAFYSLVDLFEDNKGTELRPFSLGLSFTPL